MLQKTDNLYIRFPVKNVVEMDIALNFEQGLIHDLD